MNFVQLGFAGLTLGISVCGLLFNKFEDRLPVFIRQTFRYGKFAYSGKSRSNMVIEVPKSTFKQFYKVAVVTFTYILYVTTCVYFLDYGVPEWLQHVINEACGRNRMAYTSASKTYIAIVLLTLQVYRRFYDTHFVSVFSSNGKLNFSQYLVGMFYYPGVVLAVLCEAPKFTNIDFTSKVDIFRLDVVDILAVLLFLWAWYHQHITTVILANLRKNSQGTIVADGHKVPEGDWFKYLSCPHQTAEMIMYLGLTILLWTNVSWWFVFLWVISSQVETILLSHWWYQETFPKFPSERKALIPFIY